MSRRTLRFVVLVAGAVALLFAGRWTSVLLADRWWAEEVAPSAAGFVTDWLLLRGALKLSGMLVAAAWFIGHLLAVYRAIGSVQVRRNVANLEFREALTPSALLSAVVGLGALIGIMVGRGLAAHASEVALGWQGVSYGLVEPLLQRDVGLYVAQLPLWRVLHDFCFLLVMLALGLVFGMYLLVGAIRWLDGRPAINTHARAHLGWLLVALAGTLMWGYLLEPFELIAGFHGTPDRALWRATTFVAPVLVGVALATGLLSAVWAVRGRHALAAAGWLVLPLASLAGHWMVPPALGGEGVPLTDRRTMEQFERLAYGLESLTDESVRPAAQTAVPVVASLWSEPAAASQLLADSVGLVSLEPALLTVGGRRRPVWLGTRALPGGRFVVTAMADDRTGPAGEALFYRPQDSVPSTAITLLRDLGPRAFHSRSPDYRLGRDEDAGVALDSWLRRVALAWALQAPALLGPLKADARVDWNLSPAARLARLAPFAQWGEPAARMVDGELVWIVDGYLPAKAFPLSPSIEWRQHRVAGFRAALLGTVSAQTGATRIYLRPGADALASAWGTIAAGLVEPSLGMPEGVWRAAPYPLDLFQVQARQLERSSLKPGSLGIRAGEAAALPGVEAAWSDDTTGPVLAVAFDRPGERRLSALLTGSHGEEADELQLQRFDSAQALPSRTSLESRWERFPSYNALNDSIKDEGGRLERGPVRYDLEPAGLVAYRSHFASAAGKRPALVWVAVATGDRIGAGHTLKEAWSNLLGATVPAIAGQAQATRLEEARQLLLRADSALRAADWGAFGTAWKGLRRALGLPTDSAAP
ncbi:MAG: UPF0182 family protein [Gemmatimonadales bacterium]